MSRYVLILLSLLMLSACGKGSTTSTSTTTAATASNTSATQTNTQGTSSQPASTVLGYLNSLRTLAGLPIYTQNDLLETSAIAHSNYQLTNNVMAHGEDATKPGFTGAFASDRAKVAGYSITSVSEDISFNKSTGEELIDDLMTAVYHRMGLLDFDKDEIGIGLVVKTKSSNGSLWAVLTTNAGLAGFNRLCANGGEVVQSGSYYQCNDGIKLVSATSHDQLLASLRSKSSDLIVWPPANATVPPAFYEESPDPLPECSVSGNPISVQVNPAGNSQIQIDIASFQLKEKATGIAVPIFRTLSNLSVQPDTAASQWQAADKEWFAAFPSERLNWGTTYQASINYISAGLTLTKTWEFTTKALSLTPYTVSQNATTITANGQTQHLFYIPPGDCKAGATQVNSSATGAAPVVDLQAIDPHTYLVSASGVTQVDLTFTQAGSKTYTKTVTIKY